MPAPPRNRKRRPTGKVGAARIEKQHNSDQHNNAAISLRQQRAQRAAVRLHRLPPRVLAELLVELDRDPSRPALDAAEAFSRVRLDALVKAKVGGLVPFPLLPVPR